MGRAFEFRKERKMKRWAAMSKIFARLNKDIILAIKEGGGIADPDTNARLRAVLQNCKADAQNKCKSYYVDRVKL